MLDSNKIRLSYFKYPLELKFKYYIWVWWLKNSDVYFGFLRVFLEKQQQLKVILLNGVA